MSRDPVTVEAVMELPLVCTLEALWGVPLNDDDKNNILKPFVIFAVQIATEFVTHKYYTDTDIHN